MEAKSVEALPEDEGWQFEPKWDGFRCLAVRNGDEVELFAKSGKALHRYFPEVVEPRPFAAGQNASCSTASSRFRVDDTLSFDALQMRLHPAESRIRKLAAETPAVLILFDMLIDGRRAIAHRAAADRAAQGARSVLRGCGRVTNALRLSPYTRDRNEAARWLAESGGALDGVIAKRLDGPYLPGERAMLKVKRLRTADCVVGGFRYGTNSKEVGSLLLGLYNAEGKLDHVGFTSTISAAEKPALTKKLEGLRGGAGLHRQRAGRPEPLEHRAQRRMGAAEAGAGGRGALRSRHRRPLPPRHQAHALAARQGAAAMHLRAVAGGRWRGNVSGRAQVRRLIAPLTQA